MANGDPTCSAPTGRLNRRRRRHANAAVCSRAVVACTPQAVTKLEKKYLWSWAIAGVMIPLLILLVAQFMPKLPE
jgi:hypothetical protein